MRPRDKTIECGVGVEQGVMTYFAFNEPALNTFSEVEAIKKNHAPYHLINKTEMPIKTLAQILDSCVPNGTQIDFLTVDVEGLDYEVIASNDWERYRPTIVLVELLNTSIDDLSGNMTAQFLQQQGYRVFSRTYNTFFFIKQDAVI
jgi:FkbM family methyltransferase